MSEQQDSEPELLEVSSISSGAMIFILGMLVQSIGSAIMNALLTRGLGAPMYGSYSYARTLINLFRRFGDLGSSESILRFIPEYQNQPEKQNRILGIALNTSLIGSVLIGSILYISAPFIDQLTLNNKTLKTAIQIFVFVLPFSVLIRVIANIFRGIECPKYQIAILKVLQPLSQLIAVSVALFLGYTLFGIIGLFIIAGGMVFLISAILLYVKTSFRPKLTLRKKEAYEYYDYSIPLTLTAVGSLLYSRVDVLMVGYFLLDVDVGIYNIAILVASFIGMPLSGLNQMFPPIASRLHNEGESRTLNNIYAVTTRWAFTFSLIFSIPAILYRQEIMLIFGEEFAAGTGVLLLFVVSQLIRNVVGPSGYILIMTGHQYLTMINRWLLGTLNVVLNIYFILQLGLIGAAVGSAVSLAVVNVIRVIEVYYLEGYFPYTRKYYKPIVAAIVTTPLIGSAMLLFDGTVLVFVGSISGGIFYLIILYLLGFEDMERNLIQSLVSNNG